MSTLASLPLVTHLSHSCLYRSNEQLSPYLTPAWVDDPPESALSCVTCNKSTSYSLRPISFARCWHWNVLHEYNRLTDPYFLVRRTTTAVLTSAMTSNAQPTKSRWGVGALLQQAVSGVESRLDTILANDDESPKTSGPKADDAATKSTLTAAKPAGSKQQLHTPNSRDQRLT